MQRFYEFLQRHCFTATLALLLIIGYLVVGIRLLELSEPDDLILDDFGNFLMFELVMLTVFLGIIIYTKIIAWLFKEKKSLLAYIVLTLTVVASLLGWVIWEFTSNSFM